MLIISTPFILIMVRMANRFNLKKPEAALASLLIVSFALIFPTALRSEKIHLWILGLCVLLLTVSGVTNIRNRSQIVNEKDDTTAEGDASGEEYGDPENNPVLEEIMEPMLEGDLTTVEDLAVVEESPIVDDSVIIEDSAIVEASTIVEDQKIVEDSTINSETEEGSVTEMDVIIPGELEEVGKEISCDDDLKGDESIGLSNLSIHKEEFNLEELIEKGFQAKEQGRFHLAAEWFILALDQKPSPDIAFYLIVETCEHWMNGSSIYDALDRVTPYLNEYIQNAPPEWRTQLMEWLKKENLPIPREILGRID